MVLRPEEAVLADPSRGQVGDQLHARNLASFLWLSGLRTPAVGRYVPDPDALYWPVPLQGFAYLVKRDEIVIVGI